nr:signal transducer and activator of transcription 2 [Pelodiscus sinensis]|eukprot:XP_006131311.1 signal transducer and activator of transcription 2 [Pelodiscus sinensis]
MPLFNWRPLVLKTSNKFSVRARLLVKLQDRSHQLEVEISIDKDPPSLKGFRKFNILTSTSKLLQDNAQLDGLVCDFRHIVWPGPGRLGPPLREEMGGPGAPPNSTLTWAKFSKDDPPSFSFWTWLEGILNLIRDHLAPLWKDGHIMGFVSRKRERQLLKRKQMGTFLLRFSESTRDGGITCSWVELGEKGQPKVRSVEPYTKVELASLQLPDIIHDYQLLAAENIPENPLKFLYPGTPRDQAFGKYYTERREGTGRCPPASELQEQKKYLNRRLIRVSSRQPSESWIPEGVGLEAPAAEQPGANHLEALDVPEPGANYLAAPGLEPGANHQEMPKPGANRLEMLELEASHLGMLEPGANPLEMLELEASHMGMPEPGPNRLEMLELEASHLGMPEPGANHLEMLELGTNHLEMLEALNMMRFDSSDPFLPPPDDAPPPELPGPPLFLAADDMPPLQVDSTDFQ